MNLTQRKCLIASAVGHAFLLVIVLVGPAFLPKPVDPAQLPVLDFVPDKVVDELFFGGGNPNVTEKPAPAAPAATASPPPEPVVVAKPPDPEPPRPQPQPKVVEPPPVEKPVEKKIVNDEPSPEPPKTKPKPVVETTKETKPPKEAKPIKETKPLVAVNKTPLKKVYPKDLEQTRRENAEKEAREQARREDQARRDREAAQAAAQAALDARRALVNGAIGSLAKGLSSGTQIEAPGPGGEAFANYEQFVKSVYDHAWIAPDDISDEGLTVRVRVTIRRDGNVVRESTNVERTSGNPALDTSVRRAVERVKFVHPFPEGAKDTERTFKINFNLKSKRQAG